MTSDLKSILHVLAFAGVIGLFGGTCSVLFGAPSGGVIASTVSPRSRSFEIGRRRTPQAGDAWGGCDDARAAGTAPIFSYEPGYREEMDGDNDGIACEPVRTTPH